MQYGRILENCPLRGSFYIHTKAPIKQLLQNNRKYGSRPKDFNKNKDTSKNIDPYQAKISRTRPKVNSFRFDDPYEHIHHMKNTYEDTHLIDAQEQEMEYN